MTYIDEFLISELHRFVRENGRSPTAPEMSPKNGYPAAGAYVNHFKTFNNGLEIAGLEIYKICDRLDGTETCSYCGKRADEILNFTYWCYNDGIRYCMRHGGGGLRDYVKGTLDINSPLGRGRAGEICVIKTLKIGDEHDCALISMGYPFDMYKEEYGRIDVKTSTFNYDYNKWKFGFDAKKIANTYICIAMSLDTKHVEYVWIVPNKDEIRNLTSFQIYNGNLSLKNHKKWEVNPKIYDDAWQDMLLNYTDGKCKVFGKKEKTQEEKEKSLQIRKDLIKRLGLKWIY